jgi:hypothetical protein
MHSIKTAVVVSILLVVGYAVYTSLNNERSASIPSAGGDDWPAAAKVDAPNAASRQDGNPFRQGERPFPSNGGSAAPSSWRDTADAAGKSSALVSGPNRIAPPAAAKSDRPAIQRSSPDGPAPTRQAAQALRPEFLDMMEAAGREIEKGGLVEVLRKLSSLYGRPDLSAEESRQLAELLGQLAGEVIYSRKHHLEKPYLVQPGESLQQIAEQYRVPWQLLAKINGVQDPGRLTPGSKLKVLRGPFDAVVFLDRFELVLQVNGLYAGRFPVGIGRDPPRLDGTYLVKEKATRPTYYGPNGIINPGEPDNPLGKYWIGLDERLGIHGTNDMRNLRRGDGQGAICLGDRDIEDVYDILSAGTPSWPGSQVAIRRSTEPTETLAERASGVPDRR